jgi:hypothetical protein
VEVGRYSDGVWWWQLVDTTHDNYVITDGLEPSWEKATAVANAYYRAESMRSPWPVEVGGARC